MNKTILIVLSLLAIGIAGRLIPHLPNATPIAALALLGGTYLGRNWSLVITLSVLLITDYFIGFYDWRIMAGVYTSFVLTGVIMWLAKEKGIVTIGFALLASSFTFFLITNGTVWYFSPWYEKNIIGLLYAYELGLPFLRNMFLGDIAYTTTLTVGIALLALVSEKKFTLNVFSYLELFKTDRKVIHTHTT